MKKEIYEGTTDLPLSVLSSAHNLGKHLTDFFGDEFEIVRLEDVRSPDAYQNYKGSRLVAHFVPQGVTLEYAGRYFEGTKETNFRINLFGKPEDIGEVEKIVLAEIEKVTSQSVA